MFLGGRTFFDIDGNTFDAPASYDIVNFVVRIRSPFIIIQNTTGLADNLLRILLSAY